MRPVEIGGFFSLAGVDKNAIIDKRGLIISDFDIFYNRTRAACVFGSVIIGKIIKSDFVRIIIQLRYGYSIIPIFKPEFLAL